MGRAHSSDKSPMIWMRGTMVGFKDVAPTISSKQKIHMVGPNTFIRSSIGKNLVIKGNSRIWPKAQPYKEFKDRPRKLAETCWKGSCLNLPTWPKHDFGYRCQICLTVNSSQKIVNLRLTCLESDLELNTKIIEDFLSFSMAIHMPSYNQWFKSYELWKLAGLLKFDSGQKCVTWVIRSLDHLQNGNPVNTENQTRKYFLMFPMQPYMNYSGKQNLSYGDLKSGS
jgi:hypothetical protein